jgi:hypothetical protein
VRKTGTVRTPYLIAMALSACLMGCSWSGGHAGSPAPDQRNRISYEELQDLAAANALEAVQSLRSHWLRGRSSSFRSGGGLTLPEVFVNHQHYGPLESLRQVRTESIQEMEFVSAPDATTRFGTGYTGGVIVVTLRR